MARSMAVVILVACWAWGAAAQDPAGDSKVSPGAALRFTAAAQEAGIGLRQENGAIGKLHYPEIMGTGVILFDYDGDRDLDIYFLNGNYLTGKPHDPNITNVLYRNDSEEGHLSFTDVTKEAGLGDSSYGQGGEAADFDGDGDVDLYVTNVGTDRLFRNEGGGHFTRMPLEVSSGWGQTCSALDYDRDGDLDLYVCRYLNYDPRTETPANRIIGGTTFQVYRGPQSFPGDPSVLLRNDGEMHFVDVTRDLGLYRPDGKGMGLVCLDFDSDGLVDIYESNDRMPNFLFINRGEQVGEQVGERFEEEGLLAGCAVTSRGTFEASMGVDAGDVNADGLVDLVVPCLANEIHTIYLNEWPWFNEASVECGLHVATRDRTGFSPNLMDYDNDGDLDLFISCGRVRMTTEFTVTESTPFLERYGQRPLLLANDGKGHFLSVGEEAGQYFDSIHLGRGSAAGDLDNDGRVDLVVCHSGARPAILHNQTEAGHYLTLQLVGRGKNRDAIGARVKAMVGGKTLFRWVRGGGSYLSVNDRRVHLGLGENVRVGRIEVTWPGGATQILEDIAADQFLVVEEAGE